MTQPTESSIIEKKQSVMALISQKVEGGKTNETAKLYDDYRHLIDNIFLGQSDDVLTSLTPAEQDLCLTKLLTELNNIEPQLNTDGVGKETDEIEISGLMQYIEESIVWQYKRSFFRANEAVNVIIHRTRDPHNPKKIITTMIASDLNGKEIGWEEIGNAERVLMMVYLLVLLGFATFVIVSALRNGIHFG